MLIIGAQPLRAVIDADLKAGAAADHTFDDLKSNLVTVVIAVMAVTSSARSCFLGRQSDLLGLGAAWRS